MFTELRLLSEPGWRMLWPICFTVVFLTFQYICKSLWIQFKKSCEGETKERVNWDHLPFLKSDQIVIKNYENEDWNGEEGIIIDFCPEKQRYFVEAKGGIWEFKLENLEETKTFPAYETSKNSNLDFDFIALQHSIESIKTIADAEQMMQKIEFFFSKLEDCKRIVWFRVVLTRMFMHYTNAESKNSNFLAIRTKQVQMLETTIGLADLYNQNTNQVVTLKAELSFLKNDKSSAEDLLKKHRGHKQKILFLLYSIYMKQGKSGDFDLNLLEQLLDTVDPRKYDLYVQDQPNWNIYMHCSKHPEISPELLLELLEKTVKNADNKDPTQKKMVCIHCATLYFQGEMYELCLQLIQTGLALDSGKLDGTYGLIHLLELQCRSYIALGQKKQARKVLKLINKKMNITENAGVPEIAKYIRELPKKLREQIEVMKIKPKKNYTQEKVLYSCTNPCCPKKEKKFQEFRRCSECLAVHYCSKHCQREHWKSHKYMCRRSAKAS